MSTLLEQLYETARTEAIREYKELLQYIFDNNEGIKYIQNANGCLDFIDMNTRGMGSYQIEGLDGYGELVQFNNKWGKTFDIMNFGFSVGKTGIIDYEN